MAVIEGRQLQLATVVGLLAVGQFVVSVPTSIALYPSSYSLSTDFLSELGCRRDGQILHAWIFNGSVALLGAGLCFQFGTLTKVAWHGPIELLALGGCGLCSSLSVIMVAALPYHLFPEAHTVAMVVWLLWLLPTIGIWIEWVSQGSDNFIRWVGMTAMGRVLWLLVLLFPVACLVAMGPLTQKLIVAGCLVWLTVFSGHLSTVAHLGKIHTGLAGRDRRRTSVKPIPPGTFDGFHD